MDQKNNNDTFNKSEGKVKFTDNPLKKLSKKNIISVCVFIAALLVILFCVGSCVSGNNIGQWLRLDVLKVNKGSGFPTEIIGNTTAQNNSAYFDGCYAYISDTSYTVLNHTAGEEFSIQHSYASPALKCAANRSITYDIGGYDYSVTTIDGETSNYKSDDKRFRTKE